MSFTVVVVLHDSAAELAVLLRSIDACLPARPQLVAVDTGSRDDGPALAAAWGAELVAAAGQPGLRPGQQRRRRAGAP